METENTGWLSIFRGRVSTFFTRGSTGGMPLFRDSSTLPQPLGDGLDWLQKVLDDPLTSELVREHYGRKPGGQNIEFLIACSSFAHARNPLQRFQQFSHIVHNFVQENAARAVRLSAPARAKLVSEWHRFARDARLPVGIRVPALEAAIDEVKMLLIAQQEARAARIALARAKVS